MKKELRNKYIHVKVTPTEKESFENEGRNHDSVSSYVRALHRKQLNKRK